MDILQLIDRLEELLDSGWRVPLSNKVAIDEEVFLNIIDQMRITIPPEIKQAREIQREKDRYIAQAKDEARAIISQAREDAAKQLDEHEIRQVAHNQADELVRDAQAEAARVREGADLYAEARLQELARYVGELERVIQNGLRTLDSRHAADREAEAPDEDLSDVEMSLSEAPAETPG